MSCILMTGVNNTASLPFKIHCKKRNPHTSKKKSYSITKTPFNKHINKVSIIDKG